MHAPDLPSPSSDQLVQLKEFRDATTLLYRQGRYDAAIEIATGAIQLSRSLFGDGDPAVAEDFGVLGLIYKAAGVLDRAEDCYRYAIAVLRQAKGSEAPELAQHLSNLGVLCKLLQRYEEAAV